MKTVRILTTLLLSLGVTITFTQVSSADPLGTAFSYQGRLSDAGDPADDFYDFEFKLYDDPEVVSGQQIGEDLIIEDLEVIEGHFDVELDFGPGAFNGDARWLEIGVQPGDQNDPNGYTTLNPRQRIMPTPYALIAGNIKTSGTSNMYVGEGAGGVSTGGTNTAIGIDALKSNTAGSWNTATGYSALRETTAGNGNSAFGMGALISNTQGHSNTAIGRYAMTANSTGDNNVALGHKTGYSATGDGNVFLGYEAGYNETGGDKLYIANNKLSTLIYGEFASGRVGINNTNPSEALDVAGDVKAYSFIGDGSGLTNLPPSSLWTQDASNIYYNSGGVGIGTQDAEYGANLQVANRINIMDHSTNNPNLFIGDSGMQYIQLQWNTSGDYAQFFTPSAYDIAFMPGGNVGIGTTSPAEELEVVGTVKATAFLGDGSGLTGIASGGVSWSGITDIPADIADGDDDTDTQLSEAQVESYVINGAIDLAPGSTVGGSTFNNWNSLLNIPVGFADGVDNVGGDVSVPLELSGAVAGSGAVIKGTNTDTGYGVYGKSGGLLGGYGYLGSSDYGVFGFSTNTTGVSGESNFAIGVHGKTHSDNGYGVHGENSDSGNYGYIGAQFSGVVGYSSSGNGVYGFSDSGTGVSGSSTTGLAGSFTGDVSVSGDLSVTNGGISLANGGISVNGHIETNGDLNLAYGDIVAGPTTAYRGTIGPI